MKKVKLYREIIKILKRKDVEEYLMKECTHEELKHLLSEVKKHYIKDVLKK